MIPCYNLISPEVTAKKLIFDELKAKGFAEEPYSITSLNKGSLKYLFSLCENEQFVETLAIEIVERV